MKLYRVTDEGRTLYLSPEPVTADDFPPSSVFDEVQLEVPVVDGVIHYWDGGGGKSYPHIHYLCPRCTKVQNTDLYPDDPNPRFAICDACAWDSLVWIRWKH